MGLNVQAMVDANLRFMYLAVLAGGRSSDVQAYRKSKLKNWIESLPPWYFVAGDNAYVCTEHLLTPFCGSSRSLLEYDAYNFFLSQMRIQVEMAFGMLVTKWRILRFNQLTKMETQYLASFQVTLMQHHPMDLS
jgi:hypothetical protein